jgi:8-oxo-dGTP pyrophosphatase MutT (NUDIX family)
MPFSNAALAPPIELAPPPLQTAKVLLCVRDRVLVLRKMKGIWDFPGGRAEPGETLMETLARELREETDLPLPAVRPAGQWVRHRPGRASITIHFFHAEIDLETAEMARLSQEHDAKALVCQQSAAGLPMADGYRRVLMDVLSQRA